MLKNNFASEKYAIEILLRVRDPTPPGKITLTVKFLLFWVTLLNKKCESGSLGLVWFEAEAVAQFDKCCQTRKMKFCAKFSAWVVFRNKGYT